MHRHSLIGALTAVLLAAGGARAQCGATTSGCRQCHEIDKPLLIGFAFGFLLQRAGLSRYDRIVNAYRLRDLAVMKFLLSALVVGALGLRVLGALGWATDYPLPVTYVWGVAAGGVLFGVGMALSGFCPGTVAAGAGEGRIDYLVPGFLGLFAGAVVFGVIYPHVMPWLVRLGNAGPITIAEALHVDPWIVVVLAWEIVLLLFYVLERVDRVSSADADAHVAYAEPGRAHHRGPLRARRADRSRRPRRRVPRARPADR